MICCKTYLCFSFFAYLVLIRKLDQFFAYLVLICKPDQLVQSYGISCCFTITVVSGCGCRVMTHTPSLPVALWALSVVLWASYCKYGCSKNVLNFSLATIKGIPNQQHGLFRILIKIQRSLSIGLGVLLSKLWLIPEFFFFFFVSSSESYIYGPASYFKNVYQVKLSLWPSV